MCSRILHIGALALSGTHSAHMAASGRGCGLLLHIHIIELDSKSITVLVLAVVREVSLIYGESLEFTTRGEEGVEDEKNTRGRKSI